jgi:hypothetical protein
MVARQTSFRNVLRWTARSWVDGRAAPTNDPIARLGALESLEVDEWTHAAPVAGNDAMESERTARFPLIRLLLVAVETKTGVSE